MAKFEFIASHGVHLWDLDVQFVRDPEAGDIGKPVYRFETDDAKQAAALESVEGYGITLVSERPKPGRKPAAPAE